MSLNFARSGGLAGQPEPNERSSILLGLLAILLGFGRAPEIATAVHGRRSRQHPIPELRLPQQLPAAASAHRDVWRSAGSAGDSRPSTITEAAYTYYPQDLGYLFS